MDEYISREAAINTINAYYDESESTDRIDKALNELWNKAVHHIGSSVSRIPAADVKPVVKGEWVKCGRDRRPLCSKCGYEPLEITREYIVDGKPHSWDGAYNLSNFCPNCGADMRKEANDDER